MKKYKPEELTLDGSVLSRMEAGNEVGDLAMGLFGDYVEVTAYTNGKLDLSKMMERTREEMQKGTPVICEASFEYNGLYCAVDVFKKEGNGWAIYEVRSSAKHENSTDDKPAYHCRRRLSEICTGKLQREAQRNISCLSERRLYL